MSLLKLRHIFLLAVQMFRQKRKTLGECTVPGSAPLWVVPVCSLSHWGANKPSVLIKVVVVCPPPSLLNLLECFKPAGILFILINICQTPAKKNGTSRRTMQGVRREGPSLLKLTDGWYRSIHSSGHLSSMFPWRTFSLIDFIKKINCLHNIKATFVIKMCHCLCSGQLFTYLFFATS